MYQGVVHTSLRLRSRIYNNSLGERLLFRAWNFPRSKQTSSQQRRLWISEVIWFHESESKYTPVPGRGYAPAKIFVGAKLVSVHPPSIHPPIHYRENLDFTAAGIRIAFSYCRAQLEWQKELPRPGIIQSSCELSGFEPGPFRPSV